MEKRKSNLGNVAMDVCAICQEPHQILLQSRDTGKDVFEGKMSVCTGQICDKCKKKLDSGVTFTCHTCNSLHCLKLDAIKKMGITAKKGDKFKTYKCPQCNKGYFEFLPPNQN